MFPIDISTLFPLPQNQEVIREYSLRMKKIKLLLYGHDNVVLKMLIFVDDKLELERYNISKDIAVFVYMEFIKSLIKQ